MLRVGLTGGTGAGKSTVARLLAARGATVVDADVLARAVVAPGTDGLREVVGRFGPGVLRDDGSLDRGALADVVFADHARRRELEAVTHPRIAGLTRELFARAAPDAVVVHDMPLLVEKAMGADYHLVAVVDAPEATRVERLVGARGMDRRDALARVRAQATDAQRREAADVLLDNSVDGADLRPAVDALWDGRLVPFEENLRLRRPAPRPAHVAVSPADPTWASAAVRLLARVATATGPEVLRADHIGSTSVPGLDAKDVVDLQLVVPDLPAAERVAAAVAPLGLVRREGRWWDELLDGGEHDKVLAQSADPGRAVNLHVREVASPAWRETLALRDWLRAHPDEAADYAALKHRLAGTTDDLQEYTKAKTAFIGTAVQRARAAGLSP